MEDTTNAPATTPAAAKPEIVIRTVNVNGVDFKFVEGVRGGKGEKKGHPFLRPVFGSSNSPIPAANDLATILAKLGQDALLKAFATEVLGPAAREASDNCVVTVDGKTGLDLGKFPKALIDVINSFTAAARKAEELRQELATVQAEIIKIFTWSMANPGKALPIEEQNKAQRLLAKQAEIEKELAKKTTRTPKADVAKK